MCQTSKKGSIVTLINVFTVEPADQQRLVDLLTRATDGSVNRAPGFISSTLHRSINGTKVTMYAQWRSTEDYQAMRQDPGSLPFLRNVLIGLAVLRTLMRSSLSGVRVFDTHDPDRQDASLKSAHCRGSGSVQSPIPISGATL
jgi:quinol monooxygenase YgiN